MLQAEPGGMAIILISSWVGISVIFCLAILAAAARPMPQFAAEADPDCFSSSLRESSIARSSLTGSSRLPLSPSSCPAR